MRTMARCIGFVLVAAAALGASGASPAGAAPSDPVDITEVSFDRFGTIIDGSPVIHVRITCDATGSIGDLSVDVAQRGLFAYTNSTLEQAFCTTTPTLYTLRLDAFDAAFRPGRVEITSATEHPSGERFAEGRSIVLRRSTR